jgi:hypothetical protein
LYASFKKWRIRIDVFNFLDPHFIFFSFFLKVTHTQPSGLFSGFFLLAILVFGPSTTGFLIGWGRALTIDGISLIDKD